MPRVRKVDRQKTAKLTQQPVALTRIREMILQGVLAPGERVREAHLAERLKLSRTPIRQALPTLAQEGLLIITGKRGYSVRAFTGSEILQAIEARALLEGAAARALAEQGVTRDLMEQLALCLADGDRIFSKRDLVEEDEVHYGEMNSRFHTLILEGANRPLLNILADRCNVVPFAAPNTIAFDRNSASAMYELLFYAHQQHHAIVAAIEARDGGRAEFLFREHAITKKNSMRLGNAVPSTAV